MSSSSARLLDLYENPRTTFVANFLGTSNLIEGEVVSTGGDPVVAAGGGKLTLPRERCSAPTDNGGRLLLGIRPEKISLAHADDADGIAATATASPAASPTPASSASPPSTWSRARRARPSRCTNRTSRGTRDWSPAPRWSCTGIRPTPSDSTRPRTSTRARRAWRTRSEPHRGAARAVRFYPEEPRELKLRKPSTRKRLVPYWLLLPGILWLLVFFALPLVYQASTSVQTGSLEQGFEVTWHFQTYLDALREYYPQFIRSLLYAGTATILCLLLGYPLAYLIAFKAGRWRNLVLVLVIAPFFTSFLIRTLAWKTILADGGAVVDVLNTLHVLDVTSWLGWTESNRVLATPMAVVCGLTYNFLPFMILPLYTSLERIDGRLHEAAGDLYATPATTFRKVTFPLSMPGVVSGTLLTFIPASGDYVNAELLGSTDTKMVGSVIQSQFLRVLDYPTAAALSFILMAIVLLMVTFYIRRSGTEDLV